MLNSETMWGFSWISCTKLEKEPEEALFLSTQPKWVAQTFCTFSHPHKAWRIDSLSLEQRWQMESIGIALFIKFSFEGREFVHDFHKKCLIFPGTFSFQMLFQKVFYAAKIAGLTVSSSFHERFVPRFHELSARVFFRPDEDVRLRNSTQEQGFYKCSFRQI